jgi:hypothetical protein
MRDGRIKKEMNTVCSESLDDIQFLKQQQWRLVYYCLLLFGAIFYIIVEHKHFHRFLAIASFVITFFGLYFQIDFQNQMKKNRERIRKIRNKYFHDETKKLFGLTYEKKGKKYFSFLKDWEYLFVFYFTILAGFGLAIFVIGEPFWRVLLYVYILFFAPFIIYELLHPKGIKWWSNVCGLLLTLYGIFSLFSNGGGFKNWGVYDCLIFLIVTLPAYLVGWGAVRLIYWIYCEFKEDKEK